MFYGGVHGMLFNQFNKNMNVYILINFLEKVLSKDDTYLGMVLIILFFSMLYFAYHAVRIRQIVFENIV